MIPLLFASGLLQHQQVAGEVSNPPGAKHHHLGKVSVHPLLYHHQLVRGTLHQRGDDQDHQLSPAEIRTYHKYGCEIKTQSSGRLHSAIWMDKIVIDKIAVIVTPV